MNVPPEGAAPPSTEMLQPPTTETSEKLETGSIPIASVVDAEGAGEDDDDEDDDDDDDELTGCFDDAKEIVTAKRAPVAKTPVIGSKSASLAPPQGSKSVSSASPAQPSQSC